MMKTQCVFVLSLLTIINLSCEESLLKKNVGVTFKDEFKAKRQNADLHFAKQLGDSNAQFALDLYREITDNSETGKCIFCSMKS